MRDSWAEAIYRFTYGSYQYFYVFNADPHPGNYLFHEDGRVSFLDFGCVKRFDPEQVESLNMVMRECLRGDVARTWQVSVERGFFAPSGSLTPKEVFAYWRDPVEMYWGEQPFTITPQYADRLVQLRYSANGPSANAFRHLATPATYTIMSRLEIGVISILSQLRARNYWREIGAEYFEGADAATSMGMADRAHREQQSGAVSHA